MPEILESLPAHTTSQMRYPWDEWLDGQVRRLKAGVDFQCSPDSLEVTARRQASKRKAGLSFIRERGKNGKVISICIQLHPNRVPESSRSPSAYRPKDLSTPTFARRRKADTKARKS